MAGLTLSHLENIESETSFLQGLNANFDAIVEAVNDKLSRTDTTQGQMDVDVDMNNGTIHNLGSPTSSTDAARWVDVYSAGVLTDYAVPNILGNQNKYLRVTSDGLGLYWSDSSGGLDPANNLSDLSSPSTARSNLGLGTASVYDIGGSGSRVPLLSNTHTWAGAQTWQALQTFQGGASLTGSTEWRLQTTGLTTLSSDSLGFRGLPQVTKDSNYTFVLDDAAKMFFHGSSTPHAWTIPPESSVNYPLGTVLTVFNAGTGAVTITRGSGVTLIPNGGGASADLSVPQSWFRSIVKVGSNFWIYN